MLSSVLDANLSMVSYTLNIVVKRLTSYSIILMSISIVAGIYGMNFALMPELDWRWGYPFALGLMVADSHSRGRYLPPHRLAMTRAMGHEGLGLPPDTS